MSDPFETFGRAGSSAAELNEAAARLGPVDEPASFWSAIAGDAAMPASQRSAALAELVGRHVRPGTTTVGVLAGMLGGAGWIDPGKAVPMNGLAGKVPVQWSWDDTVLAIPGPGGDGALYLAVAGHFRPEEIAAALRGPAKDPRVRSAVIRDAAVAQ